MATPIHARSAPSERHEKVSGTTLSRSSGHTAVSGCTANAAMTGAPSTGGAGAGRSGDADASAAGVSSGAAEGAVVVGAGVVAAVVEGAVTGTFCPSGATKEIEMAQMARRPPRR